MADDPAQFDAEQIEAGRKLFAGECQFVAGAGSIASLPGVTHPEIAVAGRSNVGKSSLVNALTGRNTLARTSSSPGHTRQLNFFDLANRLVLVDLPGYGFANASKAQADAWSKLAESYLRGRPSLARILVLIDARHGLKANDHEAMKALDGVAVVYVAVLTKADLVGPAVLERTRGEVAAALKKHPAAFPHVFTTSARKGAGIAELRALLAQFAEDRAPPPQPARARR